MSNLGYINIENFPSHFPVHNSPFLAGEFNYDIVMIGYLEKRKGHLQFLNDFYKQILKYDLKVAIIGGGPEFDELNNFILQSECGKNISLLGFREDYLDILLASKVLVHPSVGSEDMPLIVIEALGLGCIVASSQVAG